MFQSTTQKATFLLLWGLLLTKCFQTLGKVNILNKYWIFQNWSRIVCLNYKRINSKNSSSSHRNFEFSCVSGEHIRLKPINLGLLFLIIDILLLCVIQITVVICLTILLCQIKVYFKSYVKCVCLWLSECHILLITCYLYHLRVV